jgi:hypothetical protein
MNKTKSKFGKLAWAQFKKGLLLFVVPLLTLMTQWFIDGKFPTDWATWRTTILTCAVPVLYYIISLLQNSDGELFKKEAGK